MRYVLCTRKKLRDCSLGVGDYYTISGTTFVDAKEQKNKKSEVLIAIHEFIEEVLTRDAGIKEPDITAFDAMFEEERSRGLHDEFAEPGEDPRSPYREQHLLAEHIERLVCEKMGMDWDTHNKELEI